MKKFRSYQERLLLQLYSDIKEYVDSPDGVDFIILQSIVVSLDKAHASFWCQSDYSKEV